MGSNLLNSVKTTLALYTILMVYARSLPDGGAQLWSGSENADAIAYISPKVDDDFPNLPQDEKQTAIILGTVAVRGSGRIALPNC